MEEELYFQPGDIVHLRSDFQAIYQAHYGDTMHPLWNGLVSYMDSEDVVLTIRERSHSSPYTDPALSGSMAYTVRENGWFYRGCWFQEWVDAQSAPPPAVDIDALLKILEV